MRWNQDPRQRECVDIYGAAVDTCFGTGKITTSLTVKNKKLRNLLCKNGWDREEYFVGNT